MPDIMKYVIPVIVGVVCLVVGYIIGELHRKKVGEKAIGSAEDEATRIVNEAAKTAEETIKAAEEKKKETIIEAKEEIHKQRSETEKELRERRKELQRQETRLIQKEESVDKKIEALEKKEEALQEKIKAADARMEEIEAIKRSQIEMLERISGFTQEQARDYLLKLLEDGLAHEKALKIQEFEQSTREESDRIAREILSTAIQRCAADYTSEITSSVVPLPNDEMKGRIIGREGRNVKSFETITGVDLIIDDTPEAITISSYNPVRREKARKTLEKLIADGRIQPTSIESTYKSVSAEIDNIIRQTGKEVVLDVGVRGLHPQLEILLGQLKYRTSYGQNVLQHSIEVAHLSSIIAAELGVDTKLAKRAGLLHDIGKALDHDTEGTHVQLGVDEVKKYKESEEVIHAIQAHHGDVEPRTAIAWIVQAADAISAARPGARREDIQNYINRLRKLEETAKGFNGVERAFAIQAGREIRVIVTPEAVSDDDMVILASNIARKIENDTSLNYPGQIKVHVIRESRAIDFAK